MNARSPCAPPDCSASPTPGPALRCVLDTNVVLDLWHWPSPALDPLRECLARGWLGVYGDGPAREELARVVAYPKLGLSPGDQARVLLQYGRTVIPVADEGPAPALPRCRDRDDQKFLELAARSGAHWLISRDKCLLRLQRPRVWPGYPLRFSILPPPDAMARLSAWLRGEGSPVDLPLP